MTDEAMDIWRRETGAPPPSDGSFGPPGNPPAPRPGRWDRLPNPLRDAGYSTRAQLATVAGAVGLMLLVMLPSGWPRPIDPFESPELFLPILVPPAIAAATRMHALPVILTGAVAFIASAVIYLTVMLVWAILGLFQLIECWASWLSEC